MLCKHCVQSNCARLVGHSEFDLMRTRTRASAILWSFCAAANPRLNCRRHRANSRQIVRDPGRITYLLPFLLDKLVSVRANLPLVDTYLQAGLDALGDATRMAIFQKLAGGPTAVNELARTLPVSRPAVSQHLRVLKNVGLVTDSKVGTRRLYQLNPEGVARLRAHFDQMWTKAMSAFQETAEQQPLGEKHGKHRGRSRRT
jgi:DNA-binding transcriptional ArsR family regulator